MNINTARHFYGTTTIAEHRAHLVAHFAETRRAAMVHDVETPVAAFINENRWLIDCECGAGNYVDPDAGDGTGTASCYGCGAFHTHVVIPAPPERAAIEAALLVRPPLRRGWRDGHNKSETVLDLHRDNAAHVKELI